MSEARVIPQLRRKLALLVENEHFANLEEIANGIGTTQKTLEGWADYGSNKVTKGMISGKHYQQTLEIFKGVLCKQHGDIDVEAIVKGEVSELARYLSHSPRFTFHELVERYAITHGSKAFIDKNTGMPAVKRRSQKMPLTLFKATTKQWFWIEFQTDLTSSHTIAIQQRANEWAFSDVEYVKDEKQILIPGLRADGFPDSIQEADWDGINTFYAVQTIKPWPQVIMEAIKSSAPIDNAFLQKVADHYASNKPDNRRLFASAIDVRKT